MYSIEVWNKSPDQNCYDTDLIFSYNTDSVDLFIDILKSNECYWKYHNYCVEAYDYDGIDYWRLFL